MGLIVRFPHYNEKIIEEETRMKKNRISRRKNKQRQNRNEKDETIILLTFHLHSIVSSMLFNGIICTQHERKT